MDVFELLRCNLQRKRARFISGKLEERGAEGESKVGVVSIHDGKVINLNRELLDAGVGVKVC